MGRVVTQVSIKNAADEAKVPNIDAMVDTGASMLTLPLAWKDRLGSFTSETEAELQLANQEIVKGLVCGPALIKVSGFRAVYNEILFLNMEPDPEGLYEPLIGYVILEQAQAAVDMLGHRLVPTRYLDLK